MRLSSRTAQAKHPNTNYNGYVMESLKRFDFESLIQSSLKVRKNKNPKILFLFVAIIPKPQVGSVVFMLGPLESSRFLFICFVYNMAFIISYCIDRNSLVKNPMN